MDQLIGPMRRAPRVIGSFLAIAPHSWRLLKEISFLPNSRSNDATLSLPPGFPSLSSLRAQRLQ